MLESSLFYEAAHVMGELMAPAKINQYSLPDMCAYGVSHQPEQRSDKLCLPNPAQRMGGGSGGDMRKGMVPVVE